MRRNLVKSEKPGRG